MEYFDSRGTAFTLSKSYLSNRKQGIQLDSFRISCLTVNYSAQGSAPAALLFLFYMNDLPQVRAFVTFLLMTQLHSTMRAPVSNPWLIL